MSQKCFQNGPKMVQKWSKKMAQNGPKMPPNGPKWAKIAQIPSKPPIGAQKGEKWIARPQKWSAPIYSPVE